MILEFKKDYSKLSDRQILEQVINPPEGSKPDEEAVAYLLYVKYSPMLRNLYKVHYGKVMQDCYGDCVDDLYEFLREGVPPWVKLMGFEWRSSFGTWLKRLAYRRFDSNRSELIGKFPEAPLSMENDKPAMPRDVMVEDGGATIERREKKVRLLEAIGNLHDEDQRLVVIKKLEGYRSCEIAELLKLRWEKCGIVKYGFVTDKATGARTRQVVVPDGNYVDTLFQHAKKALKKSLS